MTEWNIQSRAHACGACGKGFSDKEHYHTLLFDDKTALRRVDACQACWEKQFSEGARDRKGFISYWQGVYEAPPPPTETLKKETAESLLRKIIELNKPEFGPAGYILAVMLERKRLLKVKERLVRDGERVFIYEHPKTGDIFTIVDPNLQLNQLEKVQHDVGLLLEHGFNPDGTVAGADAPPPAPKPAPATEPEADAEAEPAADADATEAAPAKTAVETPEPDDRTSD
jgi:hypothetical protein